jgi:Nif-specific regulatory protein
VGAVAPGAVAPRGARSAHRAQIAGITPDAAERLRAHSWPGNVRELENCIESAVVLTQRGFITGEDLSLPRVQRARQTEPVGMTLAEAEKRHILYVLDLCNGNRSRAAEMLGIGRNTLNRKMKEAGE